MNTFPYDILVNSQSLNICAGGPVVNSNIIAQKFPANNILK